MYKHQFELAGLPMNPNDFSHGPGAWRQRHRENTRWQKDVWAMCAGNKPASPLTKSKVIFTRVAFGKQPDSDNLAYSFKPVRDGLIHAGIIINDDPEHLEAHYTWEPGKYRKGFIRVTIEEVT